MKRLLKISSITGSAFEPIASRFGGASTRVITTWFFGVISARQPGSTTIVWCGSMTSAGPSTPRRSAARRADRRSPRAMRPWRRCASYAVAARPTRCDASRRGSARAARLDREKRAAPPTASADTASITSAFGRVDEAEPRRMRRLEGAPHGVGRGELHLDRRVGARVAKLRPQMDLDGRRARRPGSRPRRARSRPARRRRNARATSASASSGSSTPCAR